jgi:hypothetical protein
MYVSLRNARPTRGKVKNLPLVGNPSYLVAIN